MGVVFEDAVGHRQATSQPTALTAGAVSTTAVGTIAPTTNAGASPTVTAVTANDTAGTFTLNPVTGGGAQAAGTVAVVTFANPYAAVPKAVIVQVYDQAAGTTVVASSATGVTAAGFNVNTAILTTAHNYTVMYYVIP
jgi:hypothetical protein